jgi:hypothetical protein
MNYKSFLDEIASKFIHRIENIFDLSEIPTEDFGWANYRYRSDVFRLAHIERYSDDKIDVLHVTTFPNPEDSSPIFGFDVIATEKKVLGCYIDLSPVEENNVSLSEICTGINKHFPKRKELPSWADGIFSKDVCFIEPDNDIHFCFFCIQSLQVYSDYICTLHWNEPLDKEAVVKAQNRYCEVQATNPRTYSVLKQKLGEDRAKYFMEEILFPKIK